MTKVYANTEILVMKSPILHKTLTLLTEVIKKHNRFLYFHLMKEVSDAIREETGLPFFLNAEPQEDGTVEITYFNVPVQEGVGCNIERDEIGFYITIGDYN